MEKETKKKIRPKQEQSRPGLEKEMTPVPVTSPIDYPKGKLNGKVALITGGDSGIGKAVALLFAKEGADIAIAYLSETKDAEETKKQVIAYGRQCTLMKGDLGNEHHCKKVIKEIISKNRCFGQ